MYHGFVQQGGHDTAMKDAFEALKLLGGSEFGANPAIRKLGKTELQSVLVTFPAGKAHPVI
jgi:hypothetical protein